MMDRLREGASSIAVKIILGIIILSFVFAGVGSYIVGGGNNSAAKVGNTEIGRGEFEQAYQNERNRMQAQLGDYFSNLLADPSYVATFRKSVLDRMVNDLLLEQHAQSLGLRVSDQQVRNMIVDMPQFQVEGKFDQEVYQATLRRAGFSPDSFAEYLRRDLVRNQLLSAIQGSDFSLEGEVEADDSLQARETTKQQVCDNLVDTMMLDDNTLCSEKIPSPYHTSFNKTVLERAVKGKDAGLINVRDDASFAEQMMTPAHVVEKAKPMIEMFRSTFPLRKKKVKRIEGGRGRSKKGINFRDHVEAK